MEPCVFCGMLAHPPVRGPVLCAACFAARLPLATAKVATVKRPLPAFPRDAAIIEFPFPGNIDPL